MFEIEKELLNKLKASITQSQLVLCPENVVYYCNKCDDKCEDTCSAKCKSGAGNESEW